MDTLSTIFFIVSGILSILAIVFASFAIVSNFKKGKSVKVSSQNDFLSKNVEVSYGKSIDRDFYIEFDLWALVSKSLQGNLKYIIILLGTLLFSFSFITIWIIIGIILWKENILLSFVMFGAAIYSFFFITNQFRISRKRYNNNHK